MADVEQMWTCRTCRVPLARFSDEDDPTLPVVYLHHGGVDAGHDPDPVAGVPVLDRVAVCDFCSVPDPAWAYNTTPATGQEITQTMPDGAQHTYSVYSDSWWAACSACADLVDARDFDGLAERAYNRLSSKDPLMRRLPQEAVLQGLRQTQRVFTNSPFGARALITHMTDD